MNHLASPTMIMKKWAKVAKLDQKKTNIEMIFA